MSTIEVSPTPLQLDQDIKNRIQKLARARHRKPHWIMIEAIRQYVDREEKREQFKLDAIKAWDEYRQSGLHLTSEEADNWLEKLESGQDEAPPACHG